MLAGRAYAISTLKSVQEDAGTVQERVCTFEMTPSLGPVQTTPKSRGEASLLWTKLCREEKPLGWKSILNKSTIKKSSASRRKFGSSILLDPNFAPEAELLAP
jgi:hypothetical protein